MLRYVEDITRFIFLQDPPSPVDILFIPGNGCAEPSEYAASLYARRLTPLLLPSGRYSILKGSFSGQVSGSRTYEGSFRTEWEFMRQVLLDNGVPDSAILREDQAEYTYQNAIYSRQVTDALGITVNRAMIVCMPVHARRARMYYETLFPEAQLIVCPCPNADITAENWTQSEERILHVLEELERCGSQFHRILPEQLLSPGSKKK